MQVDLPAWDPVPPPARLPAQSGVRGDGAGGPLPAPVATRPCAKSSAYPLKQVTADSSLFATAKSHYTLLVNHTVPSEMLCFRGAVPLLRGTGVDAATAGVTRDVPISTLLDLPDRVARALDACITADPAGLVSNYGHYVIPAHAAGLCPAQPAGGAPPAAACNQAIQPVLALNAGWDVYILVIPTSYGGALSHLQVYLQADVTSEEKAGEVSTSHVMGVRPRGPHGATVIPRVFSSLCCAKTYMEAENDRALIPASGVSRATLGLKRGPHMMFAGASSTLMTVKVIDLPASVSPTLSFYDLLRAQGVRCSIPRLFAVHRRSLGHVVADLEIADFQELYGKQEYILCLSRGVHAMQVERACTAVVGK